MVGPASFATDLSMPLHVEREMVGATEGAVADGAFERLVPCVFTVMARQLI